MITKLTGRLSKLTDDCATLDVPPFEYEVLIPDFCRRRLQAKLGKEISLHTVHYIDGNAAQGGRLSPRLVGFLSEIEREFFELFCSVGGVGVKKALRAMVRPVQDVAEAIERQDTKTLSTLPGIGPATADQIVAKLKRKMPKFALLITKDDFKVDNVEQDIVEETYLLLVSMGHSETEARELLEQPLKSKKKFKDVDVLLQAVYEQMKQ